MAGLVVAGLTTWQYEGTTAKKKHEHRISYLTGGGLLMEGLYAERFELAYAVSAAGLERGGPTEASFLLLRALSLPKDGKGRWAVCAVAAAQLARQQRHMDVVAKAVELLADSQFDDLTLTPEQASTVVQKEKAERAFPTAYRRGPDYGDLFGDDLCDCPKCRRARGEAVSPSEDFDEEDGEVDLDAI